MNDLARKQMPWLVFAALPLFLLHALFYFFALGRDAVDDAYISFRYAQNAILGYGLVFNPGERVEGFTNFLWTALMLPLEGSGADVGRASMALGALFGLAILWLVLRFGKSAVASDGVGMLAALLLAVDGSFALWSVSGLETALFAFLVLAGILLYLREQTVNILPYSGLFFALAAMTRPEGLMVFALTVAHQALWRVLTERRLLTWRDVGRGAMFAALFLPYWLGRWSYYHSFLPNSFHAKVSVAGPEAQIDRGWRYLQQFVGVHLGWVVLLPAAVAVWPDRRPAVRNAAASVPYSGTAVGGLFWSTYLLALVLPYAAYIVYVGGDWSVGRFFMPLLPPFYLLFSEGVVRMWKGVVDRWERLGARGRDPYEGSIARRALQRREVAGILAGIGVAALLFWFSSWNGEYGIFIRGFDAPTATAARETMGRWLRANAPRGTWIAVDAAGQVPYFSGLPAIDMFGINDLHIGRLPVATLGQGTPGHEKFDLGYVVGRGPTYVVIYGTLLDGVKEYQRGPVGWTDNAAYLEFLTLYQKRE